MAGVTRKTALYGLLLATILYRGSFFFEIFSAPVLDNGIRFTLKNGNLAVKSLEDTDAFGRKTPAAVAGLRPGDRILQLGETNGRHYPITSLVAFSNALRILRSLPQFEVLVERETNGGKSTQIQVVVQHTSERWYWKEAMLALLWTFLLPLATIVTGFFIGFSKPEDDHAFSACLLFLCISALVSVSLYLLPSGLREFSRVYETTCDSFLLYCFMRFFLLFPSPSWIDRKMPWLKHVFFWFTLMIWLVNLLSVFSFYYSFEIYSSLVPYLAPAGTLFAVVYVAMLVIGVLSLVLNTVRQQSSDEKRRMVILLAGVVVGLVLPAIAVACLLATQTNSLWIITAIAVSLAVFPAAFAYVVVRHRVLGIRLIVRRGLQYLLISRGFWIAETILLFVLLFFLARPTLVRVLPLAPPLLLTFVIGGLTLLLYFALRRLNEPVMRAIDRRFFRQSYDAREILTELSHAVGRFAASPAELLQLITNRITRSLFPQRVAVFLKGYDICQDEGDTRPRMHPMKTDQYHCVWIQQGDNDEAPQLSAYVFPEAARVPQYVEQLPNPEALEVYLDDPRSWANTLASADSREAQRLQERELLDKLGSRLILPLTANEQTFGFLSLGEKLSEEPYSKEDKALLMTVAQQAAIALDYSKLISQVAEQERMKREMEIARQVQAQLFPQTFPSIAGLEYTGFCRAARGVGGDYYDFLGLRENLLGIALADISGKGISAALMMAGLQALMRSNAPTHEKSLQQLFLIVNRLMCSSAARGKYATFFYSVYDSDHQTLDYVNAGHLPPMVFCKDGSILRLRTGGPVVGMLPNAAFNKDQAKLRSGDVLLIYSDGVSEAMNSRDEEFGEERLIELVQPLLQKPATEIVQVVLAGIEEFVAGAPQNDDITLVVARVL